MAVNAVSSLTSGVGTAASAALAPGSKSGLTQNDFIKLLTTQMQYQDPMNPVSNTDFAAQLAQFSSLQGVQQLNTGFNQMLMLQQVSQGAGLIGKQVSYAVGGKSLPATGVVSAVQVNNGNVQLQIGNQSVSLNQITSISSGS